MTRVDNLLERIAEVIDGRTMLSLREQLLVDCADEIIRLKKSKAHIIEQAVVIVEKSSLKDKRADAVKAIKELKCIY